MRMAIAIVLGIGTVLSVVYALGDEEKEVSAKGVPAKVIKAAKKAVPGIEITEAESATLDGTVVYEVEGKLNGKDYELEIDAEGNVLEMESGKNDEEDSDDSDD